MAAPAAPRLCRLMLALRHCARLKALKCLAQLLVVGLGFLARAARSYWCFIPKASKCRASGTAAFFPKCCEIPLAAPEGASAMATGGMRNIADSLGGKKKGLRLSESQSSATKPGMR